MPGVGEVHRVYGVHELCGWMRCMGFMVLVGAWVHGVHGMHEVHVMQVYVCVYIYREREMYEDT